MFKTMDLATLFALALQEAKTSPREIVEILSSIQLDTLTSIAELKSELNKAQLDNYFPSEKSWNRAIDIDSKNAQFSISSYSICSIFYPNHLKAIDNPPPVIHVRGNVAAIQKINGIAIVGSRKTSRAGEIIAQRIASEAVTKGWMVVSGLALGIDAAAHSGALSVGTHSSTVAVLAHGLEKAKPAANAKIGDQIIENGGCWVAEHPVGTPARPAQFVSRNRIQLGLSVGSVIVEAEEKSGSITQARFCVQQKRPLFSVIPQTDDNPLNLNSAGTKLLVSKMGASPLRSRDDYPAMFERFSTQRTMMEAL